jgi:hypothetical protein
MRRRFWEWLIPSVIGLVVGLVGIAVMAVGGSVVRRTQVAASDLLFLRSGGPRFAAQPVRRDILLIQFDQKSAKAMHALPTLEQDLQLYRALLDAGATLVADTRMIADSQPVESSTVKPLLEGLLASKAEGKLFRDVWIPDNWPAERLKSYRPFIAHNLLNMHPNADGFFDSRLYPLVVAEGDGVHESMSLILARQLGGMKPTDPAQTLAEIKRCGMTALWQATLPQGMSLPAAMRADEVAATP